MTASCGYFDECGFPVAGKLDEIDVPGVTDDQAYALSHVAPLGRAAIKGPCFAISSE